MTTTVIPMTGAPVAVGAEGSVTVTCYTAGLQWFFGAPGGSAAPAVMHSVEMGHDASHAVPAGEEMYLVGEAGTSVAVSRDAAPS